MTAQPDACPLCLLLANGRRIASREQHVSDWIALGRQVVALVDDLAEAHAHTPFGSLGPLLPVPVDEPGGPRPEPRPFPYPVV